MQRILRAKQALPIVLILGASLVLALAVSVWGNLDPAVGFFPQFPLSSASTVIWQELRLPRALLAALVGASLSLCGACVQSVVRNPLAGPDVLGVSAGASFGALSLFLLLPAAWGQASLSIGALAGASSTGALVFALSRTARQTSTLALLLAGMALSSLLSGASALLLTWGTEHRLGEYLFWILGSLENRRWEHVYFSLPILLLGGTWAFFRGGKFNAFALGDQTAQSLGVGVERLKTETYIVVIVVTATCVSVSGAIGFIALLVPHAVRMVWGNDARWLFLFSALTGAVFLVLADVLTRTVFYPFELPVGIVTTVLGGPFFLILLFRRGRS